MKTAGSSAPAVRIAYSTFTTFAGWLVARVCALNAMTRLNDFPAHTWDDTRRAPPAGFPLDCLHAGRLEALSPLAQSYFVTFTCYHRLPQLNTGELRDVVVEALERASTGYRFRMYGFVVMPEHFHLGGVARVYLRVPDVRPILANSLS